MVINKIAIVSLKAGSGHLEATKSLERSFNLFIPGQLEPHFLTIKNAKLEELHKRTYRARFREEVSSFLINNFYIRKFFRLIVTSIVQPFISELDKFIQTNPDIKVYVSTHFFLTDALLRLKHQKNLNFRIINYVPDYDRLPLHYVETRNQISDVFIAPDNNFFDKIVKIYPHVSKFCIQSGFIPNPNFKEKAAILQSDAKRMLKNELLSNFQNLNVNFNENKKTIGIIGGSYWVHDSPKIIEKLIQSNIDWSKNQIVVCIGENEEIKGKLISLSNHASIVIIPFVPHHVLSLIYRSLECIILTALAPATLFELIHTGTSPIIVYKTNPNPETWNLKYALKNNLVLHEPNLNALCLLVRRILDDSQYLERLRDRFTSSHQLAIQKSIENSKTMAQFISNYVNQQYTNHTV